MVFTSYERSSFALRYEPERRFGAKRHSLGDYMIQFDTFSTAGIDPRRKMEYWNDYVSARGVPIVSDPTDSVSFMGSAINYRSGELRLGEVYSDPQIARHTHAHVAMSSEALFFVHMQLKGRCSVQQADRTAQLNPGDFALCDTTAPYALIFSEPNTSLVLGVPYDAMFRYVRNAGSLVAVRMPGNTGMSGLAADFLRTFWKQLRGQLEPAMAPRALHAALDMIAGAYAGLSQSQTSIPRASRAAAQRSRVLNYIEAHLGDSEMTPSSIAQACSITPRYLHHLFTGESETVARYILRRRLEECSKVLNTPSQRGRSLTSIAFDFGFNSATHFGRAFREQFGLTPREYRRAAVQSPAKI